MQFYKPLISARIIIFLLLGLISLNILAQKEIVKGEAEYLIQDSRLMKQYEFEVLQQAINNALYKNFGSSVTSNYEQVSSTEIEGKSVLSHSQSRNRYINSFPNGIWREHKKDPKYTNYKDKKGNWWLKCIVEGYAEQMIASPVEFVAKSLDGTDIIKDESITFISGESGYLYFRSAKSGFLTVFYDDFKTVQRCLPYNAMAEEFVQIKANQDYLFFSPKHSDYIDAPEQIDEIEYYTNEQVEYNQLYIIFSPEEIPLPVLENETKIENNYSTFKTLECNGFHRWLQNTRLTNHNLQIEIIGITIKNPNKL